MNDTTTKNIIKTAYFSNVGLLILFFILMSQIDIKLADISLKDFMFMIGFLSVPVLSLISIKTTKDFLVANILNQKNLRIIVVVLNIIFLLKVLDITDATLSDILMILKEFNFKAIIVFLLVFMAPVMNIYINIFKLREHNQ